MKMNFLYSICLLYLLASISCKHKAATEEDHEDAPAGEVQTPVTVTSISNEPLTDSLELNATSSFLQDNIVKSNINGYIQSVQIRLGQFARSGQLLFTLKTKEAESLGNTINKLNPEFHFSGIVRIVATQSGFITGLVHQVGDYVQDGEQLAVISDTKSFGFLLNVPYEYRNYVSPNKTVVVLLPDGTHLNGKVSGQMPVIDSVSQTQGVLIKVASVKTIPENLIAKVRIPKDFKEGVPSLPKQALLTDESQTSFWVMKMIDSVTAVKIPVMKGLETNNRIEIINPKFSADDKILLTGNYGLGDTAKVKIVKEDQ
jgi:hypothetical protein